MKLTAPTILLFLISLTLVVAALVGHVRETPYLSEHKFWLAVAGYGVLVFGTIFRGR
ncbi:MAG: hypothetical protein ACK41P_06320 [Asticcacaulis sp.]